MKSKWVSIAFVAAIAGCQSQPNVQQVDQQVAAPVNCATAEGDLRALQAEKVSTAKMIADGVTAITPIGLVAGTATGKEKSKLQIASGDYNQMIDRKIVQIKTTCGIQ